MFKCFIILVIISTAQVDFVIHIPSVAPLHMEMDSNSKVIFSGGSLSLVDGVNVLCSP